MNLAVAFIIAENPAENKTKPEKTVPKKIDETAGIWYTAHKTVPSGY
jgi:hypothetical protein